jgi:hypothetical protein
VNDGNGDGFDLIWRWVGMHIAAKLVLEAEVNAWCQTKLGTGPWPLVG